VVPLALVFMQFGFCVFAVISAIPSHPADNLWFNGF
jgi:hypothetical protein